MGAHLDTPSRAALRANARLIKDFNLGNSHCVQRCCEVWGGGPFFLAPTSPAKHSSGSTPSLRTGMAVAQKICSRLFLLVFVCEKHFRRGKKAVEALGSSRPASATLESNQFLHSHHRLDFPGLGDDD
ncbi:hypothetical protein MN608_03587 [Microdochium nivale]|nr:hypothetical protein MN608_03587 [Microdochium nivale]